jgi:hypothetical protein
VASSGIRGVEPSGSAQESQLISKMDLREQALRMGVGLSWLRFVCSCSLWY